jgi:hypothetical protein
VTSFRHAAATTRNPSGPRMRNWRRVFIGLTAFAGTLYRPIPTLGVSRGERTTREMERSALTAAE